MSGTITYSTTPTSHPQRVGDGMSGIRPNKKSDDELVTKFFDAVNRKRKIIK
jgi:hypothetical protein